jgi:hypothetical protein
MDARFFNKMPFPVSLRKAWLPGAPALRLQPGETVDGPYDILFQFKFLAPMPFDFHKVEGITQNATFEYTDKKFEPSVNEPQIISAPLKFEGVKEKYQEMPVVHHPQPEAVQPIIIANEETIKTLPFDPKTVDWMSIKTDELKKAAEILGIDLKALENVPLKKLKWDLIKMIKKSTNVAGS